MIVLTTTSLADERITTTHRAKLAYIYVRQSSPGQVRHHQESTELQYRLVERAISFGWPRERVQVIDDDLGKSGTSSKDRLGFQNLIAEVGLGKAGLVMSLDASRLARNNRDWHQLLELCSLFGVLIADGERLYDPQAYHDRLLLGLSGIMSEAELHQIKVRLHQGERQKAARGELRMSLPVGLTQNRDSGVTFNPDEEVQERLRLVFARFRELHSAKAVVQSASWQVACPGSTATWPCAARCRLACRNQRPRGANPEKPGLCWRLCLWPATSGPITATPRQCADRDGGRCTRGVVDLFEGRASGLCRLGRVHGEPQKVGEQCRSLRCGTVRCAAQRQCLAARDRQLWAVRSPHVLTLLGSGRRLSGLRLRCRPALRRRGQMPGGARVGGRRRGGAAASSGTDPGPDCAGGCRAWGA